MRQGDTSFQYMDRGDAITSAPPSHYLSSQVKLFLFVDFMVFYFTKTHNLL